MAQVNPGVQPLEGALRTVTATVIATDPHLDAHDPLHATVIVTVIALAHAAHDLEARRWLPIATCLAVATCHAAVRIAEVDRLEG